ncbi:MAG: hypothetical protein QNK16_05700, partial [Woeseiaceae bacterium]|nr:hypothetical protein [Woeseiaceae bacterium]MDX2607855.1 hypothetical protein [Woeseiaceae bacterium]
MIGSKIPRYFLFVLTLGIAVAAIMLSMFYGQYRWLAKEITTASAAAHSTLLRESFERRARAQLHAISDDLTSIDESPDDPSVLPILNRAMKQHESLAGLRFVSSDSDVRQTGSIPVTQASDPVVWLPDRLLMSYEVVHHDQYIGVLSGSFGLQSLQAESQIFSVGLLAKEAQSRHLTYLWIGAGTLITLLVCAGFVWLIVRRHNSRIRDLCLQAEKLSEADFGEPLA